MVQEDIIKVLEKHPEGLLYREIETFLKFSSRAIRRGLTQLLKYHEIKVIGIKKEINRNTLIYAIPEAKKN